MSVSPDKQIYTCFSCGASGNVFTFVSDFEKISFSDAVKLLGEKVENKLEFLTKTWTKKEAILKQKGIGIEKYSELKNIDGEVKAYEIKDENKEDYIVSIAT